MHICSAVVLSDLDAGFCAVPVHKPWFGEFERGVFKPVTHLHCFIGNRRVSSHIVVVPFPPHVIGSRAGINPPPPPAGMDHHGLGY